MHVAEYESSDREIIRALFSSQEWVDLYDLHIEFMLTPAQILDIIERMQEVGLAELQAIKARLTPAGREWVLAARADIFFGVGNFSWRSSNVGILQPAQDPSLPYLPDLDLVDREFFSKLPLAKAAGDVKD